MPKKREYADPIEIAERRRGNANYKLRDLPSRVYEEHRLPGEFREFFHKRVLPMLTLTGYKQQEQIKLARHCVHNLIAVGPAACVADARNNALPGVRLRSRVWDAILAAGLATVCYGSQESGKLTRYRATVKLLSLRRQWELRVLVSLKLARNTELSEPTPLGLVYLHRGKLDLLTGEPLPDAEQRKPLSIREHVTKRAQHGPDGIADPQAIANGLAYFRDVEDRIERINSVNLDHAWKVFKCDPETGKRFSYGVNTSLRQIHAGDFFRAVRLYSWGPMSGQSLSKEERQTILIDGEPSAELDFSCMVVRMLYHRKALDPAGDLYRPELIVPRYYALRNVSDAKKAIVRDFIKRATNICWNVSKRSSASSSIGKLLAEHEESDFLWKVVRQVEGCGSGDIVDRIIAAHLQLKDDFFTGVGMEMMTLDGQIMLSILTEFVVKAGKPALGIHDALVCKASDAAFAKRTMASVYRRYLLSTPKISRVY